MARLFEPFQAPRTQRTRIDPAQLAQILAAPEVAKQQARASLFQELGQLPQTIFQTSSALKQQEMASKLAPLELEAKQLQVEESRGKKQKEEKFGKLLKESVPSLAKRFPALADVPLGQVKDFLPSVVRLETLKAQGAKTKTDGDLIQTQLTNLSNLEKLFAKVPRGPAGFVSSLIGRTGQALPEAATYEANKPALAVGIYRGLTGDYRLSDADAVARALPLLPNLSDAKKVADKKLDFLRTALQNRLLQSGGQFGGASL